MRARNVFLLMHKSKLRSNQHNSDRTNLHCGGSTRPLAYSHLDCERCLTYNCLHTLKLRGSNLRQSVRQFSSCTGAREEGFSEVELSERKLCNRITDKVMRRHWFFESQVAFMKFQAPQTQLKHKSLAFPRLLRWPSSLWDTRVGEPVAMEYCPICVYCQVGL